MRTILNINTIQPQAATAGKALCTNLDYVRFDKGSFWFIKTLSGRVPVKPGRPLWEFGLSKMILLLGMLLLFAGNTFAQGDKQDKIEALRVAFITKELNLTSDESQKFWPVYNEYQDKMKVARKELKQKQGNLAGDKECQEYLDAELLFKQREVGLYKEYYEKFKKALPVKKVAHLRMAEDKFKEELIGILQHKNKNP